MKASNLFLGLTVLLVVSSCKKSNKQPASVQYHLKTSYATASINARMTAGNIQWTSGFASVAEIEFEAAKEGLEVEYKTQGKQKIDLFSPLSSLGVVSVPAGFYEDIEFEVEVQQNGVDAAFQLNGTFTNSNAVATPVIFKMNTALEIESEGENLTIADGNNLTALNILNLTLVTTGVTESMLNNAALTDGKIEISASSNSDIYQIMLNNLKGCGGVEVE